MKNSITFVGSTGGDGECFVFKDVNQSIIDRIDPPFTYIEDDETSINFGKEIVQQESFLYPDAIFKYLGISRGQLCKITISVENCE